MSIRRRLLLILGTLLSFLLLNLIVPDIWVRFTDRMVESQTHPAPELWEYPTTPSSESPFSTYQVHSGMIIPEDPKVVGSPPSSYDAEVREWAGRYGGVDASRTEIQFSLTSPAGAIVVESVDVRVLERRPSVIGVHVPVFGSGGLWRRGYVVDLDEPESIPRKHSDVFDTWDFPISVGPDDTAIFEVVAEADDYDVSWVVQVVYVSEGERRMVVYDDEGKPFRTTGTGSTTHYWEGGALDGKWVDGQRP